MVEEVGHLPRTAQESGRTDGRPWSAISSLGSDRGRHEASADTITILDEKPAPEPLAGFKDVNRSSFFHHPIAQHAELPFSEGRARKSTTQRRSARSTRRTHPHARPGFPLRASSGFFIWRSFRAGSSVSSTSRSCLTVPSVAVPFHPEGWEHCCGGQPASIYPGPI